MKCAVIGGVQSTAILIKALNLHGFKQVKVWGFEPPSITLVSGWADLRGVASSYAYDYSAFHKVTECEEELAAYEPDVLFVVGLSQIIPRSMLDIAKVLNVGFHPTALPKGRGRAAIAWLILEGTDGAATFFEIQEGIDDGAILVQEPFSVTGDDYAVDVEDKILRAEERALNRWLPLLKANRLERREQNDSQASWYGRRAPEDGWIDWSKGVTEVLKLIRASSKPHPGAYTFCDDKKIYIWKAVQFERSELGVIGRILAVNDDRSFVVQTGQGLVLVEDWESQGDWQPRVGMKLGYYLELENYKLKDEIKALKARLLQLENAVFNLAERDNA